MTAQPHDRTTKAATFHILGAVTCVVATMVAIYASFALSFGHRTCGAGETAHDIRLGIAGIGLALAAVPALVALLAHRLDRLTWPWAGLAIAAVLATAVVVLTTNQGGKFCF